MYIWQFYQDEHRDSDHITVTQYWYNDK